MDTPTPNPHNTQVLLVTWGQREKKREIYLNWNCQQTLRTLGALGNVQEALEWTIHYESDARCGGLI